MARVLLTDVFRITVSLYTVFILYPKHRVLAIPSLCVQHLALYNMTFSSWHKEANHSSVVSRVLEAASQSSASLVVIAGVGSEFSTLPGQSDVFMPSSSWFLTPSRTL